MKELITKLTEAISSLASAGSQAYPHYTRDSILDSEEVAAVLHQTVKAVDVYVCKQSLPYHKAGVKRLFFYGEVLDWLRSNDCTKRPITSGSSIQPVGSNSIQKLISKSRKKKTV